VLILWIALLVLGVAAELHSGALVGVWVAAAAAGAAVVAGLGLPPALQVAAFVVLAAVLLGAVRPLVAGRRRFPAPMRPELLVGRLGSVLDPIDEGMASGRLVVDGVPYVARSAPGSGALPAGGSARVRAVEEGELIVERTGSAAGPQRPSAPAAEGRWTG
jgi:membrane protein implicated in regulation of membrane protease activity